MPLDSGAKIVVHTSEDLIEAYALLSNSTGGGTIVIAANADPIDIDLRGGGASHVTITSEDPTQPSEVTSIRIVDGENVTITEIAVNSTGADLPVGTPDITIEGCSNISITNSTFESDADGLYDPSDPSSERGAELARVTYSDGFTFSDNTVVDYGRGLTLVENTNVTVSGNHMTGFQDDVMQIGAIQGIEISDNYMDYQYGSTVNHDDMIQFYRVSASMPTTDVLITDNILIASSDVATQTIFMRNEDVDQGRADELYENITISNNLIYNGHLHAITVQDATGVTVTDNTVLWNKDAEVKYLGPDGEVLGVNSMTSINLIRVDDGTLTGNISGSYIVSDSTVTEAGNIKINYVDPNDPNYINLHFINAEFGGQASVLDLSLLPDSPWNGTGSTLAQLTPIAQTGDDVAVMRIFEVPGKMNSLIFDATLSRPIDGVDPSEYTYHWRFSDGTTSEGEVVEIAFPDDGIYTARLTVKHDGEVIDRAVNTVEILPDDFLMMDFEHGIVDQSSYASVISGGDEAGIKSAFDGKAYDLGNGSITVDRFNDQLHLLDSFGLSLDVKLDDPDTSGRFIHLERAFEAVLHSDGHVSFELETDEGRFSVQTEAGIFDDGKAHNLSFGYDGVAGELTVAVDGDVVDSAAATGTTAHVTYYGLVLGSAWSGTIDAKIDNVAFGEDPAFGRGAVGKGDNEEPFEPPQEPKTPPPEPPQDDDSLSDILTSGMTGELRSFLNDSSATEIRAALNSVDFRDTITEMEPDALRILLNKVTDKQAEAIIDEIGGTRLLSFLTKFKDDAAELLNAFSPDVQSAFLSEVQSSPVYGDRSILGNKVQNALDDLEKKLDGSTDDKTGLPKVEVKDNDPDDDQDPTQRTASGDIELLECFVATAAYGDQMHPDVDYLRLIRDHVLMHSRAGRAFIWTYWRVGPHLARIVRHVPALRPVTRFLLSRAIARMQSGRTLERHGRERRSALHLKYRQPQR